jgi:hypothetical protein
MKRYKRDSGRLAMEITALDVLARIVASLGLGSDGGTEVVNALSLGHPLDTAPARDAYVRLCNSLADRAGTTCDGVSLDIIRPLSGEGVTLLERAHQLAACDIVPTDVGILVDGK